MNVYDFDKTIYYPDSSYHFFLYCLRRYPSAVLPVLPGTALLALRYARGKIGAKTLKERLFSFLPKLPDTDEAVRKFWETHRKNIQSWYVRQKREDDLIISASPAFLLAPLAADLGVRLIATPMDPASGKILGENCRDIEKVRRFRESFPGAEIDEFYSDSLSDAPLAEEAGKAYMVTKQGLQPWPKDSTGRKRR